MDGRLVAAAAAMLFVACAPKGEALYQRASESLEKGDARAAAIDLKNLVKDEPENARARALLARAYAESGDIQGADIEARKASSLGASPAETLVPDCMLLVATASYSKALEQCRSEGAAAADKPDLEVVQGKALLGLERAPEAKARFVAALKSEPGNLEAILGLARATFVAEGIDAAMAVFDAAPESAKSKPAFLATRGALEMQGGKFSNAEQSFSAALKVKEKSDAGNARLTSLAGLAEAQIRQGKVKEAGETADKLLKSAPDNPYAKTLRAQIAAAAGDYDQARSLLEEAVSDNPKDFASRTLLGMVNMQQGNLGQAEMHLSNVVANQPENLQAQRFLAQVRARLRSPEESLESLKPALEQPGVDSSLLTLAGRLSLAGGDRDQALVYLGQASARPAEQSSAPDKLELAGSYILAGDFDSAIRILESIPDGEIPGYQREGLLALAFLRKGDTQKAIAEADGLAARAQGDVKMRNAAATIYVAAGVNEKARQQLDAALKQAPDDATSLLYLARLDLSEGKVTDAATSLKKILGKDDRNLAATMGMAELASRSRNVAEVEKWLTKAAADHKDSVAVQVALARFYLGNRNFAKALEAVDQAGKLSPDDPAIFNLRGLTLQASGDSGAATRSFEKAVQLDPRATGYSLNLARAHSAAGDVVKAMNVVDALLKQQPSNLAAAMLGFAVAVNGQRLEKADSYLKMMKTAAPQDPPTLAAEGDLAMARKRYAEAAAAYAKVNEKAGNSVTVAAQYRAATLAGDSDAEKILENWLAKNPSDTAIRTMVAEARLARGDAAGAIREYEQALESEPDNPVMLNNLAVVYQKQGNPKGLPTAERAHRLAPDNPAIQDTYGWLLVEGGKVDKGRDLLEKAAKAMPANAEVQYHYAFALAKTGEEAKAREILGSVVDGKQTPPAINDKAKTLLASLK
jgi:putative PEP-CTERM system TPR-repeat lipoprotein